MEFPTSPLPPVRVRVGDTGAPRCILNLNLYLGQFLASTGFSADFKFMSPSNPPALHSIHPLRLVVKREPTKLGKLSRNICLLGNEGA